MNNALAIFLAETFGLFGAVVAFIGAVMAFLDFNSTHFGFATGWRKQGLIMLMGGALLMGLNAATAAIAMQDIIGESTMFEWLGAESIILGNAVVAYGTIQLGLNLVNDDFGSREFGIRVMIAGALIMNIGPLIDTILTFA